jgi:hypothetical protein
LCEEQLTQWISVWVTMLAVLVALFGAELWRWIRRPKLLVRLLQGPPDCHRTAFSRINQTTGVREVIRLVHYYRLWVENTGKDAARHVQVCAAALDVVREGQLLPVLDFLPMSLRWSYATLPDGRPEIFVEWLASGMGKHCDVGHVVDPRPDGAMAAPFILDTEIEPNTLMNHLPAETYRLTLRIGAANCRPITRILEIRHTGFWVDDNGEMLLRGTGVGLI